MYSNLRKLYLPVVGVTASLYLVSVKVTRQCSAFLSLPYLSLQDFRCNYHLHYFYQGNILLWNSLPGHTVCLNTLDAFKNGIHTLDYPSHSKILETNKSYTYFCNSNAFCDVSIIHPVPAGIYSIINTYSFLFAFQTIACGYILRRLMLHGSDGLQEKCGQ